MRLLQCANHVYSYKIICVEVSPSSPRRSLGSRLLFNLPHFNWPMRGSPPRFDNQEDDGGEDDEHIGAKESREHVHLPEDGTIGLECAGHDPTLLISGAIARRRRTYRGGELPDVDRIELQHIGRDAWQAEIEVLWFSFIHARPFSSANTLLPMIQRRNSIMGTENAVPSNMECTPFSICV